MGSCITSSEEDQEPLIQTRTTDTNSTKNKVSLIPLIFLIYFEVSGGPFGEENAVKACGPLAAIIGYLIFPFLWSVPEALITAELATAFPGNGGFVLWAHKAFGPFWASMVGTWKFLAGVINLASFPVLCADYLQNLIPSLSTGWRRYTAVLTATVFLSFLNFLGLAIVGFAAVLLGVLSYFPFLFMSVSAVPKMEPRRWMAYGDKERDWGLFVNTLFWSLNSWDGASTLAGEVKSPQRTYPRALLSAVVLTSLGYLIPLLAALAALPLDQNQWRDGYLAEAAGEIAGKWGKMMIEMSAVVSVVGMFEAQLTSSAYQLVGMAEIGMIPRAFARRFRRFDTPWLAILVSTLVPVPIAYLGFAEIISSGNFMYAMGMMLEFASFFWLRHKLPEANRPFRVPGGTAGLAAACVVPCAILVYVMAVASEAVLLLTASLTAFGVVCYLFLCFSRTRMWFVFNKLDTTQQDHHFDA